MDFIPGNTYGFTGSKHLIDYLIEVNVNDNPIFLGKFIEYVGFPHGSDWLPDAKAKFENGYISKGYYSAVTPLCDIKESK